MAGFQAIKPLSAAYSAQILRFDTNKPPASAYSPPRLRASAPLRPCAPAPPRPRAPFRVSLPSPRLPCSPSVPAPHRRDADADAPEQREQHEPNKRDVTERGQ